MHSLGNCGLLYFYVSLPAKNKKMEITGKIIAVLPLQTGEGKNGPWRSQDYVLETQDQYPKKVCFNLFGNKIDQFPVAVDDQVTVSFDIESREWNGRWFTSIRAWKVEKSAVSNHSDGGMEGYGNVAGTMPPVFEPTGSDEGTGLPF